MVYFLSIQFLYSAALSCRPGRRGLRLARAMASPFGESALQGRRAVFLFVFVCHFFLQCFLSYYCFIYVRRAVVTGAGSGIGRATALALAACGAHMALGDLDAEAVAETERRCRELRPTSSFGSFRVDCGDAADVRDFSRKVLELFRPLGVSRLDILVNNAGVHGFGPVDGDDEETFERTWQTALNVNLLGQVRMVRVFLRLGMLGAGNAEALHAPPSVVVNIASTEGLGATLFNSAYSASKHASVGLTKALAVELGARGVRVNCVCPGATRTGFVAMIPEKLKEQYARRMVPLRRYAEPEELASAIVGLCLPGMASYMNGAVITVPTIVYCIILYHVLYDIM